MVKSKEIVNRVVLILFLLSLAIMLTINARWLYVFDIHYLGITEYTEYSKQTILSNYDDLMRYLNFFWVKTLSMKDFPTSSEGAFHFFEVKRLFQMNYAILLITLVPSLKYLYHLFKDKMVWTLTTMIQGILLSLGALAFFMVVAFNQFFVLFHEVFFNNDAWIFYPEIDPIILVLPQDYFFHCFILFFVLFIFFLMILLIKGKKELKKNQ
ncbi:TIGR01906 family membrane protein [Vagococcus sp. CY52-2]|uniref:TIGR01906 family membrane protein n=1 Tax=Vagococcus sp. CY52-2 TaxID=2925838 RepID=UPI001F5657DA|nr:TIGR01906 family membrane protein [Vagococcus sp. CY52-2]UNM90095.1 TIGR01906 family membrane protein [Vagococcus sp. CY52-2]